MPALTQAQKRELVQKVMENKYRKQLDAIVESYNALVGKVELLHFEKEHREAVRKLPRNYFRQKNDLRVLHPKGDFVTTSRYVRLLYWPNHDRIEVRATEEASGILAIAPNSEEKRVVCASLYTQVKSLQDTRDALQNSFREDTEKLLAALTAFRTHKQLQDGWPEVYDLLPKVVKTQLPVVINRDKLNSDFGLPIEEKTDA